MDKPIHPGFAVLELSKLLLYETYYDTFQPYFGEKNTHLHFMDKDSFLLGVKTNDFTKDLQNPNDLFDFSNLRKSHELVSNKNKKVLGKFKTETKNIWIDETTWLTSKAFLFKCNDKNTNKLKGI